MTINQHRIAYIYRFNHGSNYAGRIVAQGFRNAFQDIACNFREYDVMKINNMFFNRDETRKLLEYDPDIIFASVEHIKCLPLDKMRNKKLVLWGQYFSINTFEKDAVTISERDKKLLIRFRDQHDILIWSQHSDEINERYFSGYQNTLGLKFIQLLHCADKTVLNKIVKNGISTKLDYVWIGKIKHRKESFIDFIVPLRRLSKNYIEYTENKPFDSTIEKLSFLYRSSTLAPNVHTNAQRQHKLLLNDRTFMIPVLGGFQIIDNPLAREYFTSDEPTPKSFIESARYFIANPNKRLPFMERMKAKILLSHTYHNRISSIFKIMNIS